MQTEAYYSDVGLCTGRRSVVVMGDRRQGRPLAARWGGGHRRRRDHWCV